MAIRTGRIEDIAPLDRNTEISFLSTLARSAEKLSNGKGWPGGVMELLADLGRITQSQRIWLFQVLELSDKHMLMNFPFEWVDDQKYALKLNPRYDTKYWDFATCSSVYRTLVESRLRREWQSIIIDDLEDCDFKEYQQIQGVQSTLSIPVMVQGQWWGLFGFDDCKAPRQWSNQEIALLRLSAHLLSAAVLRNRMASTRRQFEILSNITESSAWELDTNSGYFWCNQKIFSTYSNTEENIHMTLLQVMRHIHPNDRDRMLQYLRQQIETGDTNFRHDLRIRRGNHYVWGDVIAKISLDSKQCLRKLSGIIVEIPERKKKEEKLLRKATLDALTGIANRGSFDNRLEQMVRNHQEDGTAFSLLLLDLDHFKKINDTWGHDVGDLALKHVTAIMQKTLRDEDFVARIGGEEFAMLLPHIPPETTEEIAERIRKNIEASPLITPTATIPLSACIGITCTDNKTPVIYSCAEMLKTADEALYAAKRTGRNRVVKR